VSAAFLVVSTACEYEMIKHNNARLVARNFRNIAIGFKC
jgi:hypothetical protein